MILESGNAYGADNLLKNRKGVYVRKRSNDGDISEPLYSFNATYDNGGFAYSAAPWMEIRYAEVLLNYAEAACGAGHMGEAVEQLKLIRQRARLLRRLWLAGKPFYRSGCLYVRRTL